MVIVHYSLGQNAPSCDSLSAASNVVKVLKAPLSHTLSIYQQTSHFADIMSIYDLAISA